MAPAELLCYFHL
uniref:Uncharacterized protein n=1 Tax=Arundo donax TaxID=35708 RepID=A0A0A9EAV4_ARUDO